MIGQEDLQATNFTIYPVPNDGTFMINLTGHSQEQFSVTVYNQLGEKIYELEKVHFDGVTGRQIDLRPIPNGVYSVILSNGSQKIVRKIVVNK